MAACSFSCISLLALETKSIKSQDSKLYLEKALSLCPSLLVLLCWTSGRGTTCSATSSSVLKAGGLDHTSSIIGGQKGLVLFLG